MTYYIVKTYIFLPTRLCLRGCVVCDEYFFWGGLWFVVYLCVVCCVSVSVLCGRRERNWETSRKSENGKDGDGNPLIVGPYPPSDR
jgi:hypothetical protein